MLALLVLLSILTALVLMVAFRVSATRTMPLGPMPAPFRLGSGDFPYCRLVYARGHYAVGVLVIFFGSLIILATPLLVFC